MKMEVHDTKEGIYIDYQPGNATRYDTYIMPINRDQVVVSLPEFNTSFIISRGASLTWQYVSEKMSRFGRKGNECDASAITHLLSKTLKIPARIHTDDNGRWCDEERWVGEPETGR